MIDEIDDIISVAQVGGAGNAGWFIECDIDVFGLEIEGFIINTYPVTIFYAITFLSCGIVDFYSSGFDEFVCFATRTDTCAADVFI